MAWRTYRIKFMTDKMMQSLPTDDRGLLLGDGVFATLRALDGQLLDFDAHHQRLTEACEALRLPLITAGDMRQLCLEAVAALVVPENSAPQSDLIVRFTVTAGSGGRGLARPENLQLRLFARAFVRPPPPEQVSLCIAAIRRNEYSPTSRHKTLNYLDNILAREDALRSGFDDALMLNTKDEIACSTAGNIFWFESDRLITPALDCGVRDGAMRAQILTAARHLGLEVHQSFHSLHQIEQNEVAFAGAFICNSVTGIVPVSRLGGLIPAAHPALQALKDALKTNL
jgi:branched-subunit amino acid aminotransferase/4-amino-4-deoxychorismate lyase